MITMYEQSWYFGSHFVAELRRGAAFRYQFPRRSRHLHNRPGRPALYGSMSAVERRKRTTAAVSVSTSVWI